MVARVMAMSPIPYENLFYACSICNVFKGNDWPAEPDPTRPSYLDPSKVDYNLYFAIDLGSGRVVGLSPAADYTIVRLHLNRPQLTIERRQRAILRRLKGFNRWVEQVIEDPRLREHADLLLNLISTMARIADAERAFAVANPYSRTDTRTKK